MKNSFWIPPMTLMLSMSTADRKISLPLSTLIPDIPDISLIRAISPLMICKMGLRMHKDGYEASKHRAKYRCPKSNRTRGCFCEHPCSPAKYGRTVHIFTADNPRLFNIPPRDSKAWKKEYDGSTSVERSNKREKEDYKLEDGRHRSTRMWYCRLYGIMILQHLDAWEMPSIEAFQESLLGLTA